MADNMPMKEGTTTPSGIMTTMNKANIQQKGSAKEHTFDDTSTASGSGGASIEGPGVKGAWKK